MRSDARPVLRTKPVRLTVDMPPALHRRLKEFTTEAAYQLGAADVPAAEVIRLLIRRLTLTPRDDDYDPATADLVKALLADLGRDRSAS